MESLYDTIKEYVFNEIEELAGETIHVSDLGILISEYALGNGSVEYSVQGTIDKFNKYWHEYAIAYETVLEAIPDLNVNPFSTPERFDAIILSEMVYRILDKLPTVRDLEHEKITVDWEFIEQVIEEIEELDYVDLYDLITAR